MTHEVVPHEVVPHEVVPYEVVPYEVLVWRWPLHVTRLLQFSICVQHCRCLDIFKIWSLKVNDRGVTFHQYSFEVMQTDSHLNFGA